MPSKITTLPQTKDMVNAAINKVKGKSMVQADAPDEEGFSQLYKTVNGQRVNINPKTGSSADELTDETFSAKMDEQIGILTNIAKKLGYDKWKEIQKMVRNGTFADHYSVGDQLNINYNGSPMVWDIVAIDVAEPAEPSLTHSVTLMAHYLLDDDMMFDNKEPTNSNSYRKKYGNSRYKDSNIRLWLNSDGAAGSWWTAQHSADAAPDYASTKAGFMNGFDADFLDIIGETKIKVVLPTIDGGGYEELVDKFYLPSTTEVGLANENDIAEGSLFPYFDSNTKRTKNKSGDSADYWWLRTPVYSGSYAVRRVNSSGALDWFGAYSPRGIDPVCNII